LLWLGEECAHLRFTSITSASSPVALHAVHFHGVLAFAGSRTISQLTTRSPVCVSAAFSSTSSLLKATVFRRVSCGVRRKPQQQFWVEYAQKWGRALQPGPVHADRRHALIKDILGFSLRRIPEWLVRWGQHEEIEERDDLHATARELWNLGIAAVLTVIWRRNVDRAHPDGRRVRTIVETVTGAMAGVVEAYARYRMPVTQYSLTSIRSTDVVLRRWRQLEPTWETVGEVDRIIRIGFFDGS
jgi:hypothetical protein